MTAASLALDEHAIPSARVRHAGIAGKNRCTSMMALRTGFNDGVG